MLTKIASATELQTELRKLLAYAQTPNPSRELLLRDLEVLSLRVAGFKGALQRMETDELIKAFDGLRPGQKIKVTLKAVMGHGDSENGKPTEYIVGRRTKSRSSQNVHLLPADGSKPHPMRKVTLYKRDDYSGNTFVSVALGDMGATLLAIEPA